MYICTVFVTVLNVALFNITISVPFVSQQNIAISLKSKTSLAICIYVCLTRRNGTSWTRIIPFIFKKSNLSFERTACLRFCYCTPFVHFGATDAPKYANCVDLLLGINVAFSTKKKKKGEGSNEDLALNDNMKSGHV